MYEEERSIRRVVGRVDDTFYCLDYVFKHPKPNGFKGATGTVLRPVSEAEYEESTTDYSLRDYGKDFWQSAVQEDRTELGLDEWIEEAKSDLIDMRFDGSGAGDYEDAVLELARKEWPDQEWRMTECRGGGRCFSKDGGPNEHPASKYDEVYAPELLALIAEYEAG